MVFRNRILTKRSITLTGKIPTMRVTSKGQVTVPIAIREKLALHPGCEVRFELDGQTARLSKVKGVDPEFEAWLARSAGSADGGMTTDEIMQLTRGE